MALDEPKDKDETFQIDSLSFVVDKDLLAQTGAITIDYVSRGVFGGYKIQASNPLGKPDADKCGPSCC